MKYSLPIAAVALLVSGSAGAQPAPGALISAMDEDGDGRVSAAEFEPPHRGKGAQLLERADSNGDGRVSRAEHDAMAAERAERMAAWAEEQFERMDSDGDGYVTAEEMKRGAFERLDSDGDGYLSAEELGQARDRRPGGPGRGVPPRDGGPRD